MKRNLLKLALCAMAALPLGAWADEAQWKTQKSWSLAYESSTLDALWYASYWTCNDGLCLYTNNDSKAYSSIDIKVTRGGTSLASSLAFTASAGAPIGINADGLYIASDENAAIKLPVLEVGNVIEITCTGSAAGQYLIPTVDLSDDGIQKIGAGPSGGTTSEQTYQYEVKGANAYSFKLKTTGSTLSVKSIIVRTSTSDETAVDGKSWAFNTIYSTHFTNEVRAMMPTSQTWAYTSSGYYCSSSTLYPSGGAAFSVGGNAISELEGLTFVPGAGRNSIRLPNSGSGIYLVGHTSNPGTVNIPIARNNSMVTFTTNRTGVKKSGGDDISYTGSSDPYTYTENVATSGTLSIQNYTGMGGGEAKNILVKSITVKTKFAKISDNSPANGSLAYTSDGNEVTKDDSNTDVNNGFFCGSTVTITATPAEGYYLSALTGTYYQDGEHTTEELEISGTGNERTFTMPTTGDVTLTATFSKVPVTITAAGYATLYSDKALDFSGTGITAYVATVAGDNVTFEEVTSAPAETGLLLKGAANTYNIPVTASPASVTSALEGTLTGTTVPAGTFVLFKKGEKVGFYKTTAASFTVGANTAWLPADVSTSREFIGFDDETTGIEELKNSKTEELKSYYNLNGQRVANPMKGLYIVNGKKVIIK